MSLGCQTSAITYPLLDYSEGQPVSPACAELVFQIHRPHFHLLSPGVKLISMNSSR